ncbi:MAG: hypothetical protein ACR2H4_20060 [Pyrinomonadaceae bacterium]
MSKNLLKDQIDGLRGSVVADIMEITGLGERKVRGLVGSVENGAGQKVRQMIVSSALGLTEYLPQGEQRDPLGSFPFGGRADIGNLPWNRSLRVDRNNIPLGYLARRESLHLETPREPLDVTVYRILSFYLSERTRLILKAKEVDQEIEIARRRLARLVQAA